MANASKTHMGAGSQGKGTGTGAMTDDSIVDGRLEENMVLSNRDKSQHGDGRGLDGKGVQTEQMQDHSMNRTEDQAPDDPVSNTSAKSSPMSDQSGSDSALHKQGS
jgi:hypothetical protein